MTKIFISSEQAAKLLPLGKKVHTFIRVFGWMGADVDRAKVLAAFGVVPAGRGLAGRCLLCTPSGGRYGWRANLYRLEPQRAAQAAAAVCGGVGEETMDLIIGIDLADQSFQGPGGPAAAARCLRQLANEIEANVSNFADFREGQAYCRNRKRERLRGLPRGRVAHSNQLMGRCPLGRCPQFMQTPRHREMPGLSFSEDGKESADARGQFPPRCGEQPRNRSIGKQIQLTWAAISD
jgi:hypothetical protein